MSAQNCEHPLAKYEFGGANMGLSHYFTETKPVIFPCSWDSGGAKWVRFRINKMEGPSLLIFGLGVPVPKKVIFTISLA